MNAAEYNEVNLKRESTTLYKMGKNIDRPPVQLTPTENNILMGRFQPQVSKRLKANFFYEYSCLLQTEKKS